MFNTWENLGSIPALIGPPVRQGYQPGVMYPDNSGPGYITPPVDPNDLPMHPIDAGPTPTPVVPAPGLPPGFTARDWAACQAYIVKYRRVFGRDPVPPLWCVGVPDPSLAQPPVQVKPPIVTPPTPTPVNTSPMYHHRPRGWWNWKRPKRSYPQRPRGPMPVPAQASAVATGELCPARGWVARPIPGVAEYQTVACTPGRPVVIDQGLATVVRQGALARAGLGELGDSQATFAGLFHEFLIGNIAIPAWVPVVALGAGAFFLWRMKK